MKGATLEDGLDLVTELSAESGTFDDPFARNAVYTCAHDVFGPVEVCVTASFIEDGDNNEVATAVETSRTIFNSQSESETSSVSESAAPLRGPHVTLRDPLECREVGCTTVVCPEPLDNSCPVIEGLTADDLTIPLGESSTTVRVDAIDPDGMPQPLRTELTSETGVFDDRFMSETTFTCGVPGPVEICVEASDGDPACDQSQCIPVRCPVPENICPQLFVINAIPSNIQLGNVMTNIETRAQDTDFLPEPLTLTLRAFWGSFENTENLQQPNNVVAQDATYVCDRPGEVEICVDATDGACLKTLCIDVECPSDVPTSF